MKSCTSVSRAKPMKIRYDDIDHDVDVQYVEEQGDSLYFCERGHIRNRTKLKSLRAMINRLLERGRQDG